MRFAFGTKLFFRDLLWVIKHFLDGVVKDVLCKSVPVEMNGITVVGRFTDVDGLVDEDGQADERDAVIDGLLVTK